MATDTNAADSFGGIYAQSSPLIDANHALPDSIYANPSITGVSLKLVWDTIEPGRGSYDWSTLDTEVDRAVAAGKQISISVTPNLDDAPQWLFDKGVQKLTFVVPARPPLASRTVNIAPPLGHDLSGPIPPHDAGARRSPQVDPGGLRRR